MNTTIESCIFELLQVPSFSSNWKFWSFRVNLLQKGISGQKHSKKLFQVILKWLCLSFWWKHEISFVLVFTNHHPKTKTIFLIFLSKVLSKQTCQYENVMLIGDFNLTVYNKNLGVFMNTFNLDSLINKPTCF